MTFPVNHQIMTQLRSLQIGEDQNALVVNKEIVDFLKGSGNFPMFKYVVERELNLEIKYKD